MTQIVVKKVVNRNKGFSVDLLEYEIMGENPIVKSFEKINR